MQEKLNKLFNRITKWKESIPIGIYRYNNQSTIFASTTSSDGFNPSERAILVHRYVNRLLSNQYIRFHLEDVDKKYNKIKSPCWEYGFVISAHHGNDTHFNGYISIDLVLANTMTYKTIIIRPTTKICCEIIPKLWYDELIKMVKIN